MAIFFLAITNKKLHFYKNGIFYATSGTFNEWRWNGCRTPSLVESTKGD
jgi:hypothetical protein